MIDKILENIDFQKVNQKNDIFEICDKNTYFSTFKKIRFHKKFPEKNDNVKGIGKF